MKLADEYGIPVRMLQRMLSGQDAEELLEHRRKNPHWSTRIIDQLVMVAYVLARTNGADTAKLENYYVQYRKGKGKRQTEAQMEATADAIAAVFSGGSSG